MKKQAKKTIQFTSAVHLQESENPEGGIRFTPARVEEEPSVKTLSQHVIYYKQKKDEAQRAYDRYRNELHQAMHSMGIETIEADGVTIRIRAAHTNTVFNREKFATEHPKLYRQYNNKKVEIAETIEVK